MAERSARPERDRRRDQRRSTTTRPRWAKICSTRPACSAISRRSTAPRTACSVRSFRSTPRRPRPIAPISSTRILYGTLDKSTTVNLTPFVSQAGDTSDSAQLHQLRIPAQLHVGDARSRRPPTRSTPRRTPIGEGAGRALRRADLERVSNHSVRRNHIMFTRRGFIRVGAASVGSLALRPFGLLPALAQSGPDYRALVCVFLFGGNDSNNTIIPMDDANFQAYTSIRGSLALTAQRADADRHQRLRRAVRVSRRSCPKSPACFRARNWRWWPTSARWCSR